MAELAIKGHATRGKEVIKLLEMLGGVNKHKIDAIRQNYVYFIDMDNIIRLLQINQLLPEQYIVYSLEEFEEKFPYKVGDNVTHYVGRLLETQVITNMRWDSNYDCVLYYLDNCNIIKVEDILYKIGSPEDDITTIQDKTTVETIKEDIGTFKPSEGTLVVIDLTTELRIADEVEVILGDYEFVLKDGKTYFVKKNKYPKTYDECCDVIGISRYDVDIDLPQPYQEKMFNFFKLLICRDAYWKIAEEQMGLGKPWNQVYKDRCFIISNCSGNIHIYEYHGSDNVILAFPTAEMRDEFYDNFRDLIESCKDLL